MPAVLIHNYGLFWTRADVFWGRQNNQGNLKGMRASRRTGKPVDFRLQQGVYVLYDENFRLVYVGQAGANQNQRLFSRLKQHQNDALANRWTRFSWFGIRRVLKSGQLSTEVIRASVKPTVILDQIEAILISSTEPPLNRQGGRFGKDVKRYLQYREMDELGPDTDTMVREMWKKLPELQKKKAS